MHKLSLSFALLTYGGYWRPTKWPASSYKYHLYNIYSAFMIFLLYFITFCTCVDSLISKNLKTMSEKFSLCISVLGVSLKVANLFLQRGKIINIMNSLTKENSIPRDKHEKIIQRRNDNYARFFFIKLIKISSLSKYLFTDLFLFNRLTCRCSLAIRKIFFFQKTDHILRDSERIGSVLRDRGSI